MRLQSCEFQHNNELIPYIFVECKQRGKDINDAIEQLKSYMAVTPKCCYGVATDGNDFVIIGSKGDRMDDMPSFDLSMLPSSIQSYEFYDLIHSKKHSYLMDVERQDELIVEEDNSEVTYSSNMLTRFNLFADIAAGQPIEIVEYITDQVYLPVKWLHNNNDTFALTVRGNSMIDANINDGDVVFIKMQPIADNRSIIAAEIDGSATLKRFIRMGSSVILQPENAEYEPIMVREDKIRIIGVAVGLIKRK